MRVAGDDCGRASSGQNILALQCEGCGQGVVLWVVYTQVLRPQDESATASGHETTAAGTATQVYYYYYYIACHARHSRVSVFGI